MSPRYDILLFPLLDQIVRDQIFLVLVKIGGRFGEKNFHEMKILLNTRGGVPQNDVAVFEGAGLGEFQRDFLFDSIEQAAPRS